MQRQMLPGEEFVSHFASLALTSERLWQIYEVDGGQGITSMRLEKIEWVTLSRKQNILFLILAACCVVIGALLAMASRAGLPMLLFSLVPAGLLAMIFFATRQVTLSVGAGKCNIDVRIKGGEAEMSQALAFVDAIEEASAAATRRGAAARRAA